MPGRNPPQYLIRPVGPRKPLSTFSHHRPVRDFIDEFEQRFYRRPHRHIDHKQRRPTGVDISRIAAFTLQPPDETITLIRQGVDVVQPIHEAAHALVVGWIKRCADIDLSNMPICVQNSAPHLPRAICYTIYGLAAATGLFLFFDFKQYQIVEKRDDRRLLVLRQGRECIARLLGLAAGMASAKVVARPSCR